MSTGATNAEIAERLVVSPKTVGHHVSAVLGQAWARSRRDVRTAAVRLALTASD